MLNSPKFKKNKNLPFKLFTTLLEMKKKKDLTIPLNNCYFPFQAPTLQLQVYQK